MEHLCHPRHLQPPGGWSTPSALPASRPCSSTRWKNMPSRAISWHCTPIAAGRWRPGQRRWCCVPEHTRTLRPQTSKTASDPDRRLDQSTKANRTEPGL